MIPLSRRQALTAGASLAAASLASSKSLLAKEDRPALGPLIVFAKPLQWLSFSELTDFLDAQDWDGIEATVRRGGQVEPENIADDLPKLVEALDRKDKKVEIFASDVNSTDQPLTEKTLETAAKLGIRHYRMSYYRYDLEKPILPQIDGFARQLESLALMNKQLGMTALYQNHAGAKYLGAGLWDLHKIVEGLPSSEVAVAFDIRHATAEAGMSWPVHWSILKPRIGALYFKDFVWEGSKVKNVPLGEGLVSPKFYKELGKTPIEGVPVSVHMEYVDHRKPELVDESKRCIGNDRKAIRNLLNI